MKNAHTRLLQDLGGGLRTVDEVCEIWRDKEARELGSGEVIEWGSRWVDGEKVAEVNEIAQSILLCRETQYRLEMQACWRSQQP